MLIRFFFLVLVFVSAICPRKSRVICTSTLNGRYTKSIENFKLTVPHRLSPQGEFLSFSLPQHFSHDPARRRKKRSLEDPDLVHYGVAIGDRDYHVELWPNQGFVSPNVVFEERDPTAKVQDRKVRSLGDKKLCHYTGKVRGHPNSRAAISTCSGLAGYIILDNVRYFIEPVEEHEPNEQGHHLHVVHEPRPEMQKYERRTCGTTEDWEEAWKDSFRDKMMKEGKVEKRGTASEHRYLEVMIVADKKFIDHHKNKDVELYIMTIMNMVSDFYHDGSSGNVMDVVVVRIMYLEKEEEEIDLEISPQAEKTLDSFCQWQLKINPPDDSPIHHDIAVLLTRYDICSSDEDGCGLMGLAYVATACRDDKHCAINEDAGINLGIVVTHEVGHVMGCSHDRQGDSACEAQDPADQSYFIMAPYVHLYTTKWSTCSRGFITALFENGLGDCLNDEPQPSQYKYKNVLPGVVYDADAQCQFSHPGSSVCRMNQHEFCKMLLCKPSPSADSCLGNQEPPADGTKCGENKWCFHGQCVQIGERPAAINGGWGEWGAYSKCSRSCGGGVSTAERDCVNPVPLFLGKFCLGERKKVKICNTTPCPTNTPSFREVQCTAQNKEPFNGQMHKWKVFNKPDEPCVLYCINEQNTYSKLKERVENGTPCKAGTRDMCIDGVCKKVGCDYQFDSEAVEDICGICNGDGTQCKIIEDVYKEVAAGYKKVVTIPAGSRNVRVDELGSSMNTIAISDKTEKKFYLNGGNNEELDGEKKIGSVEGIYSHPEPGRETLVVSGPLNEDINLFVVFYKKENVGYDYKYAEPSTDTSYTPHYQWELLEWSDCTVRCGGGEQTAKYDCVEDKAGKVSSNFCMALEKPELSTKKCNEDSCKTKWKVGKWSKCHACKNRSGVRMREVVCVEESPKPGTEDILVDDDKCKGTKPGTMELCESHMKCKARSADGGDAVPSADIPSALMEEVWSQINRRDRRNQDVDLDKLVARLNSNDSVPGLTLPNKQQTKKSNTSVHLNVGVIVQDRVPPEEIKIIRVPLRKSNAAMNLSDEAFESMGDTVEDVLDTSHAEILTGNKAAKLMKEMQHRLDNETGTAEGDHKKAKGEKAANKGLKKGHGRRNAGKQSC